VQRCRKIWTAESGWPAPTDVDSAIDNETSTVEKGDVRCGGGLLGRLGGRHGQRGAAAAFGDRGKVGRYENGGDGGL
jgi:hypothetical protein